MNIQLTGLERSQLFSLLQKLVPDVNLLDQLTLVRQHVAPSTKQLRPHQAALLYVLASQLPRKSSILEIGTSTGFSAAVMAFAAPHSTIVTLEPDLGKATRATQQLLRLKNVNVIRQRSWDYLASLGDGPERYDMVFIDGHHNRIARDLPWFNRLVAGGIVLCDDYSPVGAARPSPIVFQALNMLALQLKRPFDVLMIDHERMGMAGFYRKEGETI